MDYCIIGSSKQLDGNEKLIQKIADATYSIAINYTCCSFKTKALAFLDYNEKVFDIIYKHKDNYNFAITNKNNKENIPDDYNCKYYKIIRHIISKNKEELGTYGFTVTAVLNYIAHIDEGANVYLIGIDHALNGDFEHYSNKEYEGQNTKKDPTIQINTRKFIENYNNLGVLKLYQTDYNSNGWNIPYINLREVLINGK